MVWQRGTRVYTLETTYATTARLGETAQNRVQVRPGAIFRGNIDLKKLSRRR